MMRGEGRGRRASNPEIFKIVDGILAKNDHVVVIVL